MQNSFKNLIRRFLQHTMTKAALGSTSVSLVYAVLLVVLLFLLCYVNIGVRSAPLMTWNNQLVMGVDNLTAQGIGTQPDQTNMNNPNSVAISGNYFFVIDYTLGRRVLVYNGIDSLRTYQPLFSNVLNLPSFTAKDGGMLVGVFAYTKGGTTSVWVSNTTSNTYIRYDSPFRNGASPNWMFPLSTGQGSWYLTVDPNTGDLYGVDYNYFKVYRWDSNYNLLATYTGFNEPVFAALDCNGNLWVSDYGNSRVVVFPAGSTTPSLVLGQTSTQSLGGASSTDYGLAGPMGMVFNSDCSLLWVVDSINNRILRYSKPFSTGMSAEAQVGTTGSASCTGSTFSGPYGIALDQGNYTFICL